MWTAGRHRASLVINAYPMISVAMTLNISVTDD
jgi:hypothetical protein